MQRAYILLFAILLPFLVLLGCNRETSGRPLVRRTMEVPYTHKGAMPIQVVCTTGMVADIVHNVGGWHVSVEQLMGEGVDPHLYKVLSPDMAKLNGADVIFYSGLHLEGKMADTLERMAQKKPVFPITEYLDTKKILVDEHQHPDPHLWFDVALWSEAAQVACDALSMYDPANAPDYKRQTDAYRAELAKLHDATKAALAEIPRDKRVLITSHDAFRYFGRAYDIDVKGIQGISTDAEAGLRDVNKLVDFIVTRKVKAVFVETSVNQRNMESLREGCKARGHDVVLGGELFSDAMGKDGTPEGTYIGMIRHNVETVAKALK